GDRRLHGPVDLFGGRVVVGPAKVVVDALALGRPAPAGCLQGRSQSLTIERRRLHWGVPNVHRPSSRNGNPIDGENSAQTTFATPVRIMVRPVDMAVNRLLD